MTYTVKSGDTLYGISNQYGVSVMDLMNANGITNASNLQIGQILTIPGSSGTNPDATFVYTVKKGDSLYSIARIYNTTVDEIKKINKLSSNNLAIGQSLMLPENYKETDSLPNYINYTVKRGDNLYSIAKEFNTTPDLIMKDNALPSGILAIGQNLRIRIIDNGKIEECIGPDYTPPINVTNYVNYTVKKGDSLYQIAKNYNTSVDAIKNLNSLSSNSLSIGQILKIPTSNSTNSSPTTYTVKSGDNLYSIARKFNTTVNAIKSKNGLSSNILSIGQVLKV